MDKLKPGDIKNLRKLFDDYLRMYASRDDKLTNFFSDNFSGFTGGGDFLVKDKDEWIAITRQDFAQVKDPINIELKDLSIQSLSETIAVATGFFNIHLPIKDHILSREMARLVLIFRDEPEGWKITHSSISIPYYLVREGEIYPMQELVDRNQFLEKVITERTIQLSSLNQDLQKTNKILGESERKYRLLFDRANEAIVVIQDGKVRMANPLAFILTGSQQDELMTATFPEYIHPDDRALLIDNHQRRLRGEDIPSYYIFRLLKKDGNIRWVYMNAVLIEWEGRPATLNFLTDITERKLAEEALKQSNQKWEAMISASPDGIGILSLDGKLQFFSDKLLEMYGFSPEEKEELIGQPAVDYIDPSYHKMLFDNIQKLINNESDYKIKEYLAIKKDGSRFFIDINYTVLKDENGNPSNILFIERDITERKKVELDLQQSSQKLEAIISASPDGIGMISLDGKMQLVSDQLLKMFGYTVDQRDEVLGTMSFDFIDPSNHAILMDKFQRLIAGEIDHNISEYLAVKRDKSRFYVDLNSTVLLDSNGKPSSILFIERDITERKKVEQDIKNKNLELEKLNSEKDKLFSIIAHDLKSPLHGLLGLTDVMAAESREMTADEISTYSITLHNSVVNLYTLLENLLEWAQLQKGAIGFLPEELNLSDIFSQSIESTKQRASQKDITIVNKISASWKIYADEIMINSVLRNLLSNAVKFTRTGGKVTGEARETDDGLIEISVTDTGVGISADAAGKLFNMGEKVSSLGTENEPSTGLGLILCREFVEKHGGRIWVESEPEKGSTFRFTLPKLK